MWLPHAEPRAHTSWSVAPSPGVFWHLEKPEDFCLYRDSVNHPKELGWQGLGWWHRWELGIPGFFTEQKQKDLGTKGKWVSKGGLEESSQGKTRESWESGEWQLVASDTQPGRAQGEGESREGFADSQGCSKKRYHQQQSGAFQNTNSLGEETRTAHKLKISSSK